MKSEPIRTFYVLAYTRVRTAASPSDIISFRRNPFLLQGGKISTFHLTTAYSVRMIYEQLVDFLQERMRMSTSTSR